MDVELPFVTPGYFSTLGIPLLTGRDFTNSDAATSQKVAVVNEAFAQHYFGGARNALGRHIGRHHEKSDTVIVGVVKDSRHGSPRDLVIRTVYSPALQMHEGNGSPSGFTFYVNTREEPDSAIRLIRRTLNNIDSKLVVANLRTMNSQIEETLTTERITAMLASSFGLIATLLAAIGLYGVLAYVTAQRTREIGIRMAVGAQPTAVAGLILREVILLTGVSLVFAIPASIALSGLLSNLLFNVSNTDLGTYVAGISIVSVVALLAAAIPVRRAAMVDPMKALRLD